MLDNNDRIALIDQLVQHIHQHADILKVQSGGRLIKNIERLACIPLGKFGGKLHTLLSPPESVVEDCPSFI